MHTGIVYIGLVWATLLLVACVPAVVRAHSPEMRILAADIFAVMLLIWLSIFSLLTRSAYLLDAVLLLGLLSFLATLVATRYHLNERLF